MNNFIYICLRLDIEDITNFLTHFLNNIYYLSTMFINVRRAKLFSNIFVLEEVCFLCVDFRFCFVTTAVTLHWANKRVHYSKGLGVLAEVLAIWVFIYSPSLSLASEKFLYRVLAEFLT